MAKILNLLGNVSLNSPGDMARILKRCLCRLRIVAQLWNHVTRPFFPSRGGPMNGVFVHEMKQSFSGPRHKSLIPYLPELRYCMPTFKHILVIQQYLHLSHLRWPIRYCHMLYYVGYKIS